jgi:Rrf2 family protein
MLSMKCQYALHALVYIAEADPASLVNIRQIAERKNIPKKFLENILMELKNGGFIASKKGKWGGYHLNKPAEEIQILQVIRLIDGAVAMLPCVSLNFYQSCGRCEDEANCAINRVFSMVRDQTLKILSTHTLKDLITSPANRENLLPTPQAVIPQSEH